MRRVGKNVYTEIYYWGCNPSFIVTTDGVVLTDTPQQPIDACRWREKIENDFGPIRYLINTEPHGDHISGNSYFPGVEVIGQEGLVARYAEWVPTSNTEERLERTKLTDPDSVFLLGHPNYPPNPPTRLFSDRMALEMGSHTIEIIHHPGHTAPQTSVYLPDEGVVIIGDNIFNACKTFIQEADPWQWIDSLKQIEALDVEYIVPGHGEVCDKAYIREQSQIISDWVGAVESMVQRGMSEDEALQQPAPVADPYAPGQRLHLMTDRINQMNVSNIYKRVASKKA